MNMHNLEYISFYCGTLEEKMGNAMLQRSKEDVGLVYVIVKYDTRGILVMII